MHVPARSYGVEEGLEGVWKRLSPPLKELFIRATRNVLQSTQHNTQHHTVLVLDGVKDGSQ